MVDGTSPSSCLPAATTSQERRSNYVMGEVDPAGTCHLFPELLPWPWQRQKVDGISENTRPIPHHYRNVISGASRWNTVHGKKGNLLATPRRIKASDD